MDPQTDMLSFGWTLSDVGRLMRKLADRRLSSVGMTRAQWQALGSMKRFGPVTQAALADVMEVETATIARLIDRLEAAGWVERRHDASDRRVNLVSITEKADEIMDEAGAIGQQLREDMLIDLSEGEREQLVRLLSKIRARLIRLLEIS